MLQGCMWLISGQLLLRHWEVWQFMIHYVHARNNIIGVHEMHGPMHMHMTMTIIRNWPTLAMITHTPLIATNLPIETIVSGCKYI